MAAFEKHKLLPGGLAKENMLKERKLISGFGIKTEKTRVGKKIIITESWTENLTTYHHTQK